MDADELLRRLGVALAVGFLIGTERHWRDRNEAPGQRAAGVRTFALIGLSGGLAGSLAALLPAGGAWLLGLTFLGFGAAFVPFAWREAETERSNSATTSVAAFATFALGALSVLGPPEVAGAGAVAATAVLASRTALHGWVARITWPELRSAVLLLSMSLLAAPLVPDEPIAWLAGLNPARVWSLAILLAAISFAGYLATKLIGPVHGHLVAGATAGLVSSTAVTLANARAAGAGGPSRHLAAGTLTASAVSCLRTAALVGVTAPLVARPLIPALLAVACVFAAAAFLGVRGGAPPTPAPEAAPANPFDLGPVLRLALLLAGVGVASQAAAAFVGSGGVVLVAALTGLADVDAITLSVPALAPATITASWAAAAVAAAVGANTLAKAAYSWALGGTAHGLAVAAPSLLALAGGGALLAASW